MTTTNSVLKSLHCKALNSGSNGKIMILCGGIVTTVDVFSLIPNSLVIESTLCQQHEEFLLLDGLGQK